MQHCITSYMLTFPRNFNECIGLTFREIEKELNPYILSFIIQQIINKKAIHSDLYFNIMKYSLVILYLQLIKFSLEIYNVQEKMHRYFVRFFFLTRIYYV